MEPCTSKPSPIAAPPILLRESYRDGRTVLRGILKVGSCCRRRAALRRRALAAARAVAAVLGATRAISLDTIIGPRPRGPRELSTVDLVEAAMIVGRIIAPASKLATAEALDPAGAASSLGVELAFGEVARTLYAALDWLLERRRDRARARQRHLEGRTLGLQRLVELRRRPLLPTGRAATAATQKGKLQIVYGLLCAPDGCRVAIEVFEADVAVPPPWPIR